MSLYDDARQKLQNRVYILLKLCRKNRGLFFSGHGVDMLLILFFIIIIESRERQ